MNGPNIETLPDEWTAERLEEYIKIPSVYISKNKRLQNMAKKYPNPMPVINIREEKRLALVDYLLSKNEVEK